MEGIFNIQAYLEKLVVFYAYYLRTQTKFYSSELQVLRKMLVLTVI
jgi:hypothetical protein